MNSRQSLKEFECPICHDFFDVPCLLKCDHAFCLECIVTHFNQKKNVKEQKCPVCQQLVNVFLKRPAEDLVKRMINESTPCSGCKTQVPLSDHRMHRSKCTASSAGVQQPLGSPQVLNAAEDRYVLTNRYTFPCSYCAKANFDREGLLNHCAKEHQRDPNQQRVCTICAAMPWGNANQRSRDLMQHMHLRHKFDYEYYVDFDTEEQEALRRAIEESMQY